MKKTLGVFFAVGLLFFGAYGQGQAETTAEQEPKIQENDGNKLKYDLYGKIIFDGFYTSSSEDNRDGKPGMGRKDGFDYSLLDLSRIGVTLEYGKFNGVVELGTSLENIIRLFYAQYNFDNGGYILIGQETSMASYSFGQVSNVQNALIDYGALNDVRRPMVKYGIHGFNIGLLANTSVTTLDDDASVGIFDDVIAGFETSNPDAGVTAFTWIPRLEVTYDIESDVFNGSIFGAYAYYLLKSKNEQGNYKNYGIQSFHVGFGGQFDIGNFFIQTTAYYGMNLTLTNTLSNPLSPVATIVNDNNKISVENVQSAGGAIGFGYRINNMFTPQIGAGFSSSFGGPIAGYDDAWGGYVNVIIEVNKWLAITPEVAFMDDLYDGNGNKQGNKIYAGAQIEISF